MVFIIKAYVELYKKLNFVFIDYPLLIKYLVIFRWHQITKTLPQIRYLEVPTPHILRLPR